MRRRRFCQVEVERLCSLHMRTTLYVLLALAAPAFAGQTVYKWTDEKGVTHFSDQPRDGAEKVELSSGPARAEPGPSYSAPAQQAPVKKGPAYSRLAIESPQQDESIINTGGVVGVRLAISPQIESAHVVALYLDGARVEDFPKQGTSYEFSNMPRGTHTVKAVVSTVQGAVVQETPPVTFHVRQESAAQPPVGPALRPNQPKRTIGNKLNTKQPTYAALNGGMPKMDPRTNLPVPTKSEKPKTLPAGPKNTGSKDKDSTPPPNGGK